MRLAEKVALVTGGAQGIGLACAKRFLAEGVKVVIADVNTRAGEAAAGALGTRCRFVACDVGEKAQVDAAVAATVAAFGRLDICVANAGTIHTAEFLDIAETDFDRVIRINLKGVFLTGQAAARQMVKQGGGGVIVNMSSCNAVLAIPNQVPYTASKGGVNQLTKVMAISLARHGIRVNAIGPGSIMTDILKVVMNDEAARKRILSRTPLGRIGDPDEIAKVAVFLASEDASYITGQTIYPDGGRMPLNYTVPVEE
ncbi:MAG TPA: SDR family oxidoreductase [Alphaproteobacteria bacterium]|nr:SDR family oxidoreductase [Alphaproteobacteria bacterium]